MFLTVLLKIMALAVFGERLLVTVSMVENMKVNKQTNQKTSKKMKKDGVTRQRR